MVEQASEKAFPYSGEGRQSDMSGNQSFQFASTGSKRDFDIEFLRRKQIEQCAQAPFGSSETEGVDNKKD